MRLHQLEAEARRALSLSDSAAVALTEAQRGQLAAQQAQRDAERALSQQVARVAALEAALAERVSHLLCII